MPSWNLALFLFFPWKVTRQILLVMMTLLDSIFCSPFHFIEEADVSSESSEMLYIYLKKSTCKNQTENDLLCLIFCIFVLVSVYMSASRNLFFVFFTLKTISNHSVPSYFWATMLSPKTGIGFLSSFICFFVQTPLFPFWKQKKVLEYKEKKEAAQTSNEAFKNNNCFHDQNFLFLFWWA